MDKPFLRVQLFVFTFMNNILTTNLFLLSGQKIERYFFNGLLAGLCPSQNRPLALYLKKLSQHLTIKTVCEIEGIDLTPFDI